MMQLFCIHQIVIFIAGLLLFLKLGVASAACGGPMNYITVQGVYLYGMQWGLLPVSGNKAAILIQQKQKDDNVQVQAYRESSNYSIIPLCQKIRGENNTVQFFLTFKNTQAYQGSCTMTVELMNNGGMNIELSPPTPSRCWASTIFSGVTKITIYLVATNLSVQKEKSP